MTDNDHKQEENGRPGWDDDVLDRGLNAALTKHVAVEPRAGLEERVLAAVRAERIRAAEQVWRYWPRAAALAAAVVIVVTASLLWRSWKPALGTMAHHPANPVQEGERPKTESNAGDGSARHPVVASERKRRDHGPHVSVVVAAEPKLEQFPSPRPLSDQEKILASYVTRYPEHAMLIAQARAEALRRDATEKLQMAKPQ